MLFNYLDPSLYQNKRYFPKKVAAIKQEKNDFKSKCFIQCYTFMLDLLIFEFLEQYYLSFIKKFDFPFC